MSVCACAKKVDLKILMVPNLKKLSDRNNETRKRQFDLLPKRWLKYFINTKYVVPNQKCINGTGESKRNILYNSCLAEKKT